MCNNSAASCPVNSNIHEQLSPQAGPADAKQHLLTGARTPAHLSLRKLSQGGSVTPDPCSFVCLFVLTLVVFGQIFVSVFPCMAGSLHSARGNLGFQAGTNSGNVVETAPSGRAPKAEMASAWIPLTLFSPFLMCRGGLGCS